MIDLFARIPIEVWNKIVEEKWWDMRCFLEKYDFGRFSVLMVSVGLNDYQLKGWAEIVYWPRIEELLEKNEVPNSLEETERMLAEFYKSERLADQKLKRLNRFILSSLARSLWNATPEEVAKDFSQIWLRLSETMRQKPSAKTIAFAMETLGIVLLMTGISDFSIGAIIPVDSRIRSFTRRIGISAKMMRPSGFSGKECWKSLGRIIYG